MAKLLFSLMAALLCQIAIAEPKVTYVGMGRYACTGSDRECEPVRRRNDELEAQRQQTRELELLSRELEKQTELLKDVRSSWESERIRGY